MEGASSSSSLRLGRSNSELQLLLSSTKRWKDQRSENSPERTKVWTEPRKSDRRVPVVYYLTRSGQLEHPHFIEVPLSSPSDGLYLRDVINRLNSLRGKAMAGKYSWSSKRSYKNGFVWHDLAEDDFIYPAHGQEYVLKGSELLEGAFISKTDETLNLTSKQQPPPEETPISNDGTDFLVVTRGRNQSWSAIDLHEYKVYEVESPSDSSGRAAANASTQTEETRRRRRAVKEIENERLENQNQTTEPRREEISPPPSDSSPETLMSLMKADGKISRYVSNEKDDLTASSYSGGRMKASTVLMQLLTCGSFKNCGPGFTKNHPSFSLTSLPCGNKNGSGNGVKEGLDDKEYFSGSLIQETNMGELSALKRSSSYYADR